MTELPPLVSLYVRAFTEARRYWRRIGSVFGIGMLSVALGLLAPVPVKIIVDNVLGNAPPPGLLAAALPPRLVDTPDGMLAVALGLGMAFALLTGLRDIAEWQLRDSMTERMQLEFRGKMFFRALHSLPLLRGARDRYDAGYRIGHDAQCLQWMIVYGIMPSLGALVSVCAMLYVTASISPRTATVVGGFCIPLLLLHYFSQRCLRDRWRGVKDAESDALAVVNEALGAAHVVDIFGRQDLELARYLDTSRKMLRIRMRVVRVQSVIGLAQAMVIAAGTMTVLYFLVRDAQAQVISVGDLVLVVAYVAQLHGPLQFIGSQLVHQQGAVVSAERAFEMMDDESTLQDERAARAPPAAPGRPTARPERRARGTARGGLEFRGVSFRYGYRAQVIEGLSLEIPFGTYVCITGETGAGKTTLINLLLGIVEPTQGEILLGGIDLRDYRRRDLRSQFSVATQDPVLFSASIADNIAYGRPGASLEAIKAAARQAQAHGFIEGLPDGYRTRVGDRGVRLSGGERQRIALARAFLKDAPLLLLDEPTSAVDPSVEAAIIERIEALARERTILLITHRLRALRRADIVLRVEGGRVASIPPRLRDAQPAAY